VVDIFMTSACEDLVRLLEVTPLESTWVMY